jgi:FKBP-type peptidyl-prolyl cis-trans isomerase FkpA
MRTIIKAITAVFAIAIINFSCLKQDNAAVNCTYDPCSLVAPAAEVTALETYLFGAGITNATKHCSGMYYRIDTPGTGKTPAACSQVVVKYKGQFTNGTTFDSNATGFVINLASNIIEGWKKGVPLIKEGGKIILYIPPSLAYGATGVTNTITGAVVIPPNATLVFEIELITVG